MILFKAAQIYTLEGKEKKDGLLQFGNIHSSKQLNRQQARTVKWSLPPRRRV